MTYVMIGRLSRVHFLKLSLFVSQASKLCLVPFFRLFWLASFCYIGKLLCDALAYRPEEARRGGSWGGGEGECPCLLSSRVLE